MNKLQKDLNFTCQECQTVYQLLETHQAKPKPDYDNCLTNWQNLLHSHFQEQIILFLAQAEAKKDKDQNNPDHDSK